MLKNVEKTDSGYKTKFYSMFKFIKGNRPIDLKHVAALIASYEKYGYLRPHVVVNERHQILNGQHTFTAAKETNRWIYFRYLRGEKLPAVQGLNKNAKNWNTDTFMESFVVQKRPDYLIYKRFKEKYLFGHRQCFKLLAGTSSYANEVFNDGAFKVLQHDRAVLYAERIWKVKKHFGGYTRAAFVGAMINCFNNTKYDHDRFLHKLTLTLPAGVPPLSNQTSVGVYLELIEGIYNIWCKGKEKKVFLRML